MYLYIAVEIPRPTPIAPKGVVAVDVNERYVYYGKGRWQRVCRRSTLPHTTA